jgi:hypothetical protein
MAKMAGAQWIGPTQNRTAGGMTEVHGLVLHIQDGTEAGSEAWFQDPDSHASAHFLNPRAGSVRQLIDTADRAWAQAAGNPYWVSIENEGRAGDALTTSQVQNCAQVLAWLHHVYAVPLTSTTDTMGRGLAYHGMGGAAWGNHPDCPGARVLGQRTAILAAAQRIVGVPTAAVSLAHVIEASRRDPGLPQGGTTYPGDVRPVESALRAEGLLPAAYAADGSFGSMTRSAYSRWQQSTPGGAYRGTAPGQPADGTPGLDSLRRLGARHGWGVRA